MALYNKNKTNKKRRLAKKAVLIALVIILLIGASFFIWQRNDSKSNTTKSPSVNSGDTDNDIDYSPASDEDKVEAAQNKENIVKREQAPQTGSSVTPIIVYAGLSEPQYSYSTDYEVNAYVPGIFEDGGTCTMTATKGSAKVIHDSQGSKDATNTRCGNFIIKRSEFPSSGTWSVTVSYKSASYQGASASQNMEVK